MPVPVLTVRAVRPGSLRILQAATCHNTSLEMDMYAWVSVVFIAGLFEEDLSGPQTEGVDIVYSASCLKVETKIG